MRIPIASLLLLAILFTTSCDAVYFSGNLNTTTVTGTVSIVQLTVTNNGTQITFLTLVQTAGPLDLRLCGNHASQLAPNSTVTVSFTPGTPCASNVAVTLII